MFFKRLSSKRFLKLLLTAGVFSAAFFMLIRGLSPVKYDISPGSISPADIYAHRNVVDKLATERQREAAAEKAAPQFDIDSEIATRAERDMAEALLLLEKMRAGGEGGAEDARSGIGAKLSGASFDEIMALSDLEFLKLRAELLKIQRALLGEGVSDKEEALALAARDLEERGIKNGVAAEALLIFEQTIVVNKTPNERATEQERERARNAVDEVLYKTNQVIVRRGEVVSAGQFQMLKDLGLILGKGGISVKHAAGVFLLLLSVYLLFFVYLKQKKGGAYAGENLAMILEIIFLLQLLIIFLSRGGGGAMLCLVPTAVGAVLISLIFDVDIALLANAAFAVLAGVMLKGDMVYMSAIQLIGGFAIFSFSREGLRRTMVYSAIWLSAAAAGIFFFMGLIGENDLAPALLRGGYGAINGVITSVFVIGSLPFWETAFDIITPFRLVDLSNPNQKLLKRLLLEAPGTYHHSLMVGNLAEAAAGAVGANALLARVGAYYHDVGKLKRPIFFSENRIGESPHETMEPEKSAAVIHAHVNDGVAMAKQFRLPKKVREIVGSHHGTTYAAFFLHKAKEQGGAADESAFRYPGPLPASKEAAIVMLADSVEAAVRAMEKRSEGKVSRCIEKIITERFEGGQLSQSELTIKDLGVIAAEFEKVLSGYFHERIQYPGGEAENG